MSTGVKKTAMRPSQRRKDVLIVAAHESIKSHRSESTLPSKLGVETTASVTAQRSDERMERRTVLNSTMTEPTEEGVSVVEPIPEVSFDKHLPVVSDVGDTFDGLSEKEYWAEHRNAKRFLARDFGLHDDVVKAKLRFLINMYASRIADPKFKLGVNGMKAIAEGFFVPLGYGVRELNAIGMEEWKMIRHVGMVQREQNGLEEETILSYKENSETGAWMQTLWTKYLGLDIFVLWYISHLIDNLLLHHLLKRSAFFSKGHEAIEPGDDPETFLFTLFRTSADTAAKIAAATHTPPRAIEKFELAMKRDVPHVQPYACLAYGFTIADAIVVASSRSAPWEPIRVFALMAIVQRFGMKTFLDSGPAQSVAKDVATAMPTFVGSRYRRYFASGNVKTPIGTVLQQTTPETKRAWEMLSVLVGLCFAADIAKLTNAVKTFDDKTRDVIVTARAVVKTSLSKWKIAILAQLAQDVEVVKTMVGKSASDVLVRLGELQGVCEATAPENKNDIVAIGDACRVLAMAVTLRKQYLVIAQAPPTEVSIPVSPIRKTEGGRLVEPSPGPSPLKTEGGVPVTPLPALFGEKEPTEKVVVQTLTAKPIDIGSGAFDKAIDSTLQKLEPAIKMRSIAKKIAADPVAKNSVTRAAALSTSALLNESASVAVADNEEAVRVGEENLDALGKAEKEAIERYNQTAREILEANERRNKANEERNEALRKELAAEEAKRENEKRIREEKRRAEEELQKVEAEKRDATKRMLEEKLASIRAEAEKLAAEERLAKTAAEDAKNKLLEAERAQREKQDLEQQRLNESREASENVRQARDDLRVKKKAAIEARRRLSEVSETSVTTTTETTTTSGASGVMDASSEMEHPSYLREDLQMGSPDQGEFSSDENVQSEVSSIDALDRSGYSTTSEGPSGDEGTMNMDEVSGEVASQVVQTTLRRDGAEERYGVLRTLTSYAEASFVEKVFLPQYTRDKLDGIVDGKIVGLNRVACVCVAECDPETGAQTLCVCVAAPFDFHAERTHDSDLYNAVKRSNTRYRHIYDAVVVGSRVHCIGLGHWDARGAALVYEALKPVGDELITACRVEVVVAGAKMDGGIGNGRITVIDDDVVIWWSIAPNERIHVSRATSDGSSPTLNVVTEEEEEFVPAVKYWYGYTETGKYATMKRAPDAARVKPYGKRRLYVTPVALDDATGKYGARTLHTRIWESEKEDRDTGTVSVRGRTAAFAADGTLVNVVPPAVEARQVATACHHGGSWACTVACEDVLVDIGLCACSVKGYLLTSNWNGNVHSHAFAFQSPLPCFVVGIDVAVPLDDDPYVSWHTPDHDYASTWYAARAVLAPDGALTVTAALAAVVGAYSYPALPDAERPAWTPKEGLPFFGREPVALESGQSVVTADHVRSDAVHFADDVLEHTSIDVTEDAMALVPLNDCESDTCQHQVCVSEIFSDLGLHPESAFLFTCIDQEGALCLPEGATVVVEGEKADVVVHLQFCNVVVLSSVDRKTNIPEKFDVDIHPFGTYKIVPGLFVSQGQMAKAVYDDLIVSGVQTPTGSPPPSPLHRYTL